MPLPLQTGRIKNLILKTLKKLNQHGDWSIDIIFLSEAGIRELNKKYLGRNCPTDVITFDYGGRNADIAVSLTAVKQNAKTYRTSPGKELMLYIIHGLLHLSGYNDNNYLAASLMHAKEEEILRRIINSNDK